MRLKDKIAYVTGAASGLGAATAIRFAQEGAIVVCSDIDDERAKEVLGFISQDGGEGHYLHHDVAKPEDWRSVEAFLADRFGGLDIMVNNAGVGALKNIEDISFENWRKVMAINLDSVFLGAQMAVRLMKMRGGGAIINVSSIYGIVSEAKAPAYSTTKGGVRFLTKSVALHCAEQGYNIRCNSIHPGFIDTRIGESEMMELSPDQADEMFSRVAENIPMGKNGVPADIASGMVYLASDEAGYVTGTELIIDGGFSIR